MDDVPRSKGRGRPPLATDDRSAIVSVRLPTREVDRLYVTARRQRVSVAELVRKAIRACNDPEAEPPKR